MEEVGRKGPHEHQRTRSVDNFWLGKYEITQKEWETVMGTNPSKFKGETLPVESVTWSDAMKFCQKLTALQKESGKLPEGYEYSLPTETQREYACRAGTTTALNNGKNLTDKDVCPNLNEVGWYEANSKEQTHPVGKKLPNAWGLYDMHGNVSEWVSNSDWAVNSPDFEKELTLRENEWLDGTYPEQFRCGVARGGDWNWKAWLCRSGCRHFIQPLPENTQSGRDGFPWLS